MRNRKQADGGRAELWGRAAEEAAARWYGGRGGRVLERRRRTGGGEVDLVVGLGGARVFVEVKARRTHAAAFEAVTPRGQARLARAATAWLGETGWGGEVRLDVAAVDRAGAVAVIENAVMA